MDNKEIKDVSVYAETKANPKKEIEYRVQLEEYIKQSGGSWFDKVNNFPKYVSRQHFTRYLTRYELFKKVLNVHGSIMECGVLFGGGLMSWAQYSSILEPVNSQRNIIGFDTFSGFVGLTDEDKTSESEHAYKGGLAVDSYEDLKNSIDLFDQNRFIGHIPKVKLVKGDIVQTMPQYFLDNPHTLVSLLYLDMDIYEPTYHTIKNVISRMPKGAIIAFDEVNCYKWPGETIALLSALNINDYKLERFTFDSYISYITL